MIDEELREEIFDLVTDSPCRKCDFWDVQGRYCWLKNMHPDSKKCKLLDSILSKVRQHFEQEKAEAVRMERERLKQLLNTSVVTYRAASFWGAKDFKCVEILMEKGIFESIEALLGSINGRIEKQFEGGNTNESIS